MAPNGGNTITFTEVDEVNNPTTAFIYSELPPESTTLKGGKGKAIRGRVDTTLAPSSASTPWSTESFLSLLVDVFLPAGYPHSVSDDYVPYQIFDSLQAFSSSIAGLLSSRAVLQGVGVGNADASPTSALLLHVLQDTSGRIATILFAHRVGTALEPECKMYRFAADIFNDLAIVLDCLSPMIPAGVSRVAVLSAAGVLRALCGVAGGSSKASLSAHFARWGNLAEVNAKDSSQETVISLIGMLVGSLVVSHVTSFIATWFTLLLLLSLHLTLNYAAVRSVQMTTLNRQRANIVFSTLLSSDPDFAPLAQIQQNQKQHRTEARKEQIRILTPAQVSKQERIFETNGVLKWFTSSQSLEKIPILGTCQIGVSLRQFLALHRSLSHSYTYAAPSGSFKTTLPLAELTSLFASEDYILSIIPATNTRHTTGTKSAKPKAESVVAATILLKPSSTPKSQLKSWMHALLAARVLIFFSHSQTVCDGLDINSETGGLSGIGNGGIISALSRTLTFLNESSRFEGYIDTLRDAGWDVDVSALETRVGRRVAVS